MQHSHIMAQRDGKTIIVSKAVRLTAADILQWSVSRGLSPLTAFPQKYRHGAKPDIFVVKPARCKLCSVGLPSNETRQGLLDWIPTRHSNHVTALERKGWDDQCEKARRNALALQHRRGAESYGCAKCEWNENQNLVVQAKDNSNQSGSNQHCQVKALTGVGTRGPEAQGPPRSCCNAVPPSLG